MTELFSVLSEGVGGEHASEVTAEAGGRSAPVRSVPVGGRDLWRRGVRSRGRPAVGRMDRRVLVRETTSVPCGEWALSLRAVCRRWEFSPTQHQRLKPPRSPRGLVQIEADWLGRVVSVNVPDAGDQPTRKEWRYEVLRRSTTTSNPPHAKASSSCLGRLTSTSFPHEQFPEPTWASYRRHASEWGLSAMSRYAASVAAGVNSNLLLPRTIRKPPSLQAGRSITHDPPGRLLAWSRTPSTMVAGLHSQACSRRSSTLSPPRSG